MRPDFRFLIYIRSIYSPTMMAKRVKTMTTRGREHSVSRIHFSFCLDIYIFLTIKIAQTKLIGRRVRESDMTLLGRLFNSSQTKIDDTFFVDCLREISWNIIKSITEAGVSGAKKKTKNNLHFSGCFKFLQTKLQHFTRLLL